MIKKLGIFVLFLVILFSTFIYFILDTRYGLIFSLNIATKIIPGQLTYKSASGRLGHEVTINAVTYSIDDTIISTNQLHLSWQWKTFLTSFNTPLTLHVKQAKINIAQTETIAIKDLYLNGLFSLNKHSQLQLKSTTIQYVISPTLTIHIPQLTGTITGNYNDYQTNLTLQTKADTLPVATWQIQASGSTEALTQLNLTGSLLQGNVILNGKFAWLPHLSWQGNLSGNNLNIGAYWENIPGKIHFALNSQGQLIDDKPQISLTIQDISGHLMNLPLLANGKMQYQTNNIVINNLNIISGDNVIKANGHVADTANLIVTGTLPNLGQLIPNISGQASLQANISGAGDNPFIKVDGKVTNLSYKETQAETIHLTINGYPLAPKPLSIQLNANAIKNNDQTINQIHAELIRDNDKLNFKSAMDAKDFSFKTAAVASQNKNSYQGNLTQLTITHQGQNILFLKSPIAFKASQNSLNITPNCIYSSYGSTCIKKLDMSKQQDKLHGSLNITANDFSYLTTLIPQIENPKGNLTINMQLAGTTENPVLTGKSQVRGSVTIPYLKTNLNPINVDINGNEDGRLTYTASITSKTPLVIKGTTDLSQSFATNMSITGNNFEVINNDEAKILASPALTIDYKDKNLNLEGNINIPFAKITPLDFTSTTTLPSDVIIVDNQKEKPKEPINLYSKIDISLGKTILFSYAGLTAKLSGGITLTDRPGGDTTATGTLSIDKGAYKAYGQDLTIRRGKLIYTGGSVTNPGLNIEAVRHVNIVTTSSGGGGSAAYASNKQVVGIRIQGSADEPRLTLFSEPSGLSQSDILSYLLLGKGTGQAGSAGAGTLLSALSFLDVGSHAESNIKNQLDHSLGLDVDVGSAEEYDAESGEVVNNTSLMLGKSISSKLKINYSIGIIVPINILTITYQLTEHFSLKSDASTQGTGVDIFYHYSRD